jgi:diadenosine tetraphosphate (Ap4A) HIT family hydrolase
MTCPFCRWLAAGDCETRSVRVAAIRDAYTVAPGHTLVLPVRHVADFFELDEEQAEIWLKGAEMVTNDLGRIRTLLS